METGREKEVVKRRQEELRLQRKN